MPAPESAQVGLFGSPDFSVHPLEARTPSRSDRNGENDHELSLSQLNSKGCFIALNSKDSMGAKATYAKLYIRAHSGLMLHEYAISVDDSSRPDGLPQSGRPKNEIGSTRLARVTMQFDLSRLL